MADDTVLTNLYVIANLESANDAVFVYVNIISDCHSGIFESSLLLHITWSNYAFLSYHSENSNLNISKVTPQHCTSLNNCLAVNLNFVRALNKNLS